MSTHGRVLVAMSGGVDSSVAAVMLSEQGYEVIGITMKTWDYASTGPSNGKQIGCCTLESMNDARSVALKYGFTHFIIDIREEFGDWVIDRFTDEYMAGRTPNPCVLCNTHIKWAALLKRADALGCDAIATGHYARVRHDDVSGRHVLMKGLDDNKDQSYALWGVDQAHFARTILPLGTHSKPEIRRMATDFGLDRVADKPDSYEICFVPDNDYRRFLRDRVTRLDEKVGPGDFVTADGSVIGRHDGYPFYTIGQRHGLGLALGHPIYVTGIDAKQNRITVGPRDELMKQALVARQINLIKYDRLDNVLSATGKIRYKDEGAPCRVSQTAADELEVVFEMPRPAVTPGQAVVLYEGDDVLGGAWIHHVVESETRRQPRESALRG
ncbi:MAG: tRNA 2-thiouridine(34) synthase MnmA [Rhodothermales bacterium]|nr:tRNA 2-thiouridine(34) synthase MnmA [Rhodothermales bacterium]